ncbi:MAG: DDE-type integrase/transposase/recombinase [Chloroflexota bacterium]|nr:DDE-type integrase/transposase/recombinase [Chloroflexota bacterium]
MTTYTTTYTVSCPACGHDKVRKAGVQSGKQRYRCYACNKRFRHGMELGKRVPAEQVGAAVRMFYMGMSYKQIAEAMADAYDIPEPSKATIYEWVCDYTDKATEAMKDHKADVDDSWVADEMLVRVGGEKMWNWNVMDEKTRYILASLLTRERDAASARKVIQKALDAAQHPQDRQANILHVGTAPALSRHQARPEPRDAGGAEQQPFGAVARHLSLAHQDAARAGQP